ncbi:MAG: hypothetical protein GY705_10610, partial [Bacteroidetes bacterium]|nr:hypothetical protein [Bacteroidota bacterium]
LEIEDESHLFQASNVLSAKKKASSLFGILDEDDYDIKEEPGMLIGEATIDVRIKKLILSGGYIDLGWLAPRSEQKFQETTSTSSNKTIMKVKPSANIDEWRDRFTTYAIIYTSRFKKSAPEMFAYTKRIYGLKFRSPNSFLWRLYDEEFRKLKAVDPTKTWDKIHQPTLFRVEEVLNQTSYKLNLSGQNTNSQNSGYGNSNQNQYQNVNKNKSKLKFPKNGTCHSWNMANCKAGGPEKCKFKHICSFCLKNHKAINCTNRNN